MAQRETGCGRQQLQRSFVQIHFPEDRGYAQLEQRSVIGECHNAGRVVLMAAGVCPRTSAALVFTQKYGQKGRGARGAPNALQRFRCRKATHWYQVLQTSHPEPPIANQAATSPHQSTLGKFIPQASPLRGSLQPLTGSVVFARKKQKQICCVPLVALHGLGGFQFVKTQNQ